MTHRTIRRAAAVVALVSGSIALAGCISLGPKDINDAPASVPHPTATKTAGAPGADDLIVRTADTELRLESLPEEAGYEGMPDGAPALTGDELYVFVRQDGWMLFAEQRGGDVVGCGPDLAEPEVTDLGDGWWKVTNRSEADTYALWLHAGSGPGLPMGGTVGASQAYVEWTTETAFDVPATSALDITTYGDADGLSITLSLSDVDTPLTAVKATITAVGDTGSVETELSIPDWACDQPGDLTLHAPLAQEKLNGISEVTGYTAELYLDGTTYTATGDINTAASAEPKWSPALP
ncbi:hypothetical protein [Microbacterium sp. 77mftsu3.1]|uniref:hypothetical protein n=1 Tax=Microbacterium sp. 77mftsu3.1 TaxID=1761802 RepID=UPI00035CAD74|nr:hypothetical protein [Microbacterium sp. 77mftsu3.1]SDH35718.1 hypothetical protein SAMN04488590_3119 [Microbacterium sp. 77mftsu3.1]